MITLHEAIIALNPLIVVIHGDIAYDKDGNEVSYDLAQAQAKLTELQANETFAIQAQTTAKESALAKLIALGLTKNEITTLIVS
jgi:DNA-binding NarL/FixJ family response regulator